MSGTASEANFCTLLVATYQHIGQLPLSADNTIREHIVNDYITTAPRVIAAAPPPIAAAAATYLTSVAQILTDLDKVGLNAQKLPQGQLGPLLLDPRIKAAGAAVIAYAQNNCHYAVGG